MKRCSRRWQKLGKDIQITSTYAGDICRRFKRTGLSFFYVSSGADIIYHAAATTGQGIFQEAKALNETGSKDKVWVIGVDRDQNEDGKYTTKDGKDDNLTLASTIKGVNIAVKKSLILH